MKLLMENWRRYLNENEQPDYGQFYLEIKPNGKKEPVKHYEYPDEGMKTYGIIEDPSYIVLRRKDNNKLVMYYELQRYQGLLGHSDISDIDYSCGYLSDNGQLDDEEESYGCVETNIERMGFINTDPDFLYSGAFYVEDYSLSRPILRSLSEALRESVLSIIKNKYKGKYYGYHEGVHPMAYSTKHEWHVINSMTIKGFLKKLPVDYFKPKYREKSKFELRPLSDVESEYTIFVITGKAQLRFALGK